MTPTQSLREQIVDIVERHLDEIVDETVEAYAREIPAVASAPPATRTAMRAATMRTIRAFLEMYASPQGQTVDHVERARAVTLSRAGELFDREDILEMVRIGREAMYRTARRFVDAEIDSSEEQRTDLRRQLDTFIDELERSDEVVTRLTPDALTEWLDRAEQEGPEFR